MPPEQEPPDTEDVPSNAFVRGAKLVSLPASMAARGTWGLGKRIIGQPAQAVSSELQRRTADQVFSVLGQLKGGAMKLGQTMSVMEAALPEDLAQPYRDALTKLQDSAPPMGPATVNRVMTEEFGENWRTQFTTFDERPAAAASIGQVHRATWNGPDGGIDVAVKLQYPGAAKALISDLKQLARISRLLSVLAPGMDMKALISELRERVVEELDYRLEAESQQAFHDAFADSDDIAVPETIAHTEHALVSTWLENDRSLADVITDGSEDERNRQGAAYVRFLFAGPARAGLLHADPHPGNYRVLADGRLGVVDYGAVARFPGGLPPVMGRLLRAAVEDDYDTVRAGLIEEGFLKPGDTIPTSTLQAYLDPLVDPCRQETFTFSRAWLRTQTMRISQRSPEAMGTARKINIPRQYLLVHRVWMGGIAVLSQLGASAPFRQIMVESLPGFALDDS